MKIVQEKFKVYVNTVMGQFPDEWAFAAWQGFTNKTDQFYDYDVKTFEAKAIESIPYGKNIIVVADIELTRKYFQLNDILEPTPFNIPDALNKPIYTGRTFKIMTAGEFLENRQFPLFVKPHSQVKQFSSGVVSTQQLKEMEFHHSNVQSDDLVMVAQVVDFLTEYRVFIRRGKIIGAKHYQGDYRLIPDFTMVDKMISEWKDAPLSYTLDVGVIKDDPGYGEKYIEYPTVLVEAQDMWSIGHYGLDCREYATCLQTRWLEIIQNRTNIL